MSHKNGHCKNEHYKYVKNRKNRHPASKHDVSLFLDKSGVSDVVGNILMVAITVIMATIIAGAIFGMEPPADVPHVNYEIETSGTNLTLTHMGGQQVKVSELKFMADGVEVFNTTNSEINNTGIWKIGTTITLLGTNNLDLMIVHMPSQELL